MEEKKSSNVSPTDQKTLPNPRKTFLFVIFCLFLGVFQILVGIIWLWGIPIYRETIGIADLSKTALRIANLFLVALIVIGLTNIIIGIKSFKTLNFSKRLAIISASSFLIQFLLFGGAIFLAYHYPTFEATHNVDTAAERTQKSSWETIKNDRFGLSFNYPKDVFPNTAVSSSNDREFIVTGSTSPKEIYYHVHGLNLYVAALPTSDYGNLDKNINSTKSIATQYKEEVTNIDGIKAIKSSYFLNEYHWYEYAFERNNNLYLFHINYYLDENELDKNKLILDKIASSIKLKDNPPAGGPKMDTSSWKTFKDADSQFEFNYPETVFPYFIDGGRFLNVHVYRFSTNSLDKNDSTTLHMAVQSEPADSDPYLSDDKNYFKGQYPNDKDVKTQKLSGMDWLEISNVKTQYSLIALLKRNNYILNVSFSTSDQDVWDKNKDSFNQILSSFKFTLQGQTIDTSSWKTYTNTKYGYLVKYPSDILGDKYPNEESNPVGFVAGDDVPDVTNCTNIRVTLTPASQTLDRDILKMYPDKPGMRYPGSTEPLEPNEVNAYTNTIDKSITGYWVTAGGESISKNIFIRIGKNNVEFSMHGCGAGDSYSDHPKTQEIVENMIPTFKLKQ